MRICIYGSSGVGKTTLSKILSYVLYHELEVIHGDDFIRCDSEDWNSLETHLIDSNSFIFDHISSPTILKQFKIIPDLAVGIRACTDNNDGFGESNLNYVKQTVVARSYSRQLIEVNTVREAVENILQYLQNIGKLPVPPENFIVKIASHCNLSCSYCYMYQSLDDSVHSLPRSMSLDTASQLGARLAEHFDSAKAVKVIRVILHGGEPLSLRPAEFKAIVSNIKVQLGGRDSVFSVQTNATRITRRYLDILDECGIHIGVSLDGVSAHSNRHRVYPSGASAYERILRGINMCMQYQFQNGSFGGVLCVVDPNADGKDTYRQLRALGLNSFDFLLRDEHHSFAPGGQTTENSASKFLCDAFDEWLIDSTPCDVRLFNVIISLSIGATYSIDSFGLYPYNALSVGVTGNWELLDIFRICWTDAWKTQYSIQNHSVADVMASKELSLLYQWQYDLSDSCLKCEHLTVCGGGYLPHRYHPTTGFRNPSSHCDTLFAFISHVQIRLKEFEVL